MINIDKESILNELKKSISDIEKDKQYIKKFDKTRDKVKYLRLVKGYTQEKTANIIDISIRQVQRIERELRSAYNI
ncbi:MAG: RNA polymerase subunit sigma [Clostridium cadaveris]|uniref:RNA polymerase subunit sigma n=1 Tax=Clostridium cadaveris TaxID=1529 RepID=UPI0025A3AE92|nr:RNA polymerase subunit sigma [Clostridium cadaveris]MDM8312891.1 RNA polymerase subunit sigma [Clostridium cadaveris]MDY4950152.1 RNA polymerase subunit sigma [Clostridium cadaveris]